MNKSYHYEYIKSRMLQWSFKLVANSQRFRLDADQRQESTHTFRGMPSNGHF